LVDLDDDSDDDLFSGKPKKTEAPAPKKAEPKK